MFKHVAIFDNGFVPGHGDAMTNSPWEKMSVITHIRGGEGHQKSVAFGLKGEWGILNVGDWSIYGGDWYIFHHPIDHAVPQHQHPPLGIMRSALFFPVFNGINN